MRITVELLKEHNACEEQVNLFEQFLDGREYLLPTDRNIRLAYKYGLNVIWANDRGLIKFDGCYENNYGSKVWYQNGLLHRLDGPAYEGANGTKYWYQNGKYHRLDGPAIEYTNGDKLWYQNGKLHRLDGPAFEGVDGHKAWWQNGKRHRLDGPAVEYASGTKLWYINDKELTETEFVRT